MKRIVTTLGILLAAGLAQAADTYTWGNVAFEGGGFVDGIIPSHTQAGLVYARTDVGGAYRWDSTGGKWIPLLDWAAQNDGGIFGTEALALDPQDSKKLYITCGISYFNKGKTLFLRSSDYGATFDTFDVTSKFQAHGNGMGRQAGEKLAVDPQNSGILFCGTRTSGLFRSADTGRTWNLVADTKTLSGTDIVNHNGISFVLFDPKSGKAANGGTKTIYLGVATSSVASLWVSTDGGVSFKAVVGSPSHMAMRAVLVGGEIYGTYSDGPGPHSEHGGSVWKYATSSGTWTNITPKDDSGYTYAGSHASYGYAFGGISVDPKNSKRFVLSTESCYGGNAAWPDGKGNAGDVIFLSEDAGATWKVLNPWSAKQTLDPNGNNWISGSSIHWAGTLEFDPFDNKKVWVGSGNGIFRTDDVSATVPVWKFQSRGIEETVPMEVVSVPGGPLVTAIMDYDGATYDDITVTQPVHDHPIGGSNSLGYAALVGGFLRSGRVTDYGVSPSVTYDVLYHSADSGRTWKATDTASLPGSAGSLAMSADGRVFLLRPSYTHNGKNASTSTFYRSTDAGKTWTAVKGINSQSGKLLADPVNPANFYIIVDGYQGDVLASTDTGATFAKVSNLSNTGSGEYSASSGLLRAAPGAAGDLWVALDAEQPWTSTGYSDNGLAHSTDGGKTWTRIKTMTACLSVGLGKAAPNADYYALYMWGKANGDALGIYRSIDKGATWTRINDGKHQYGGPANGGFVVGDFNTYGRVYMSTAGRGIVVGNIGPIPTTGVSGKTVANVRHIILQGRSLQVTAAGTGAQLELRSLQGRLISAWPVSGSASIDLGRTHGLVVARLVNGTHTMESRSIVLP